MNTKLNRSKGDKRHLPLLKPVDAFKIKLVMGFLVVSPSLYAETDVNHGKQPQAAHLTEELQSTLQESSDETTIRLQKKGTDSSGHPLPGVSVLASAAQNPEIVNINIDASKVTHQMKGGIGASWHALIHDIPMNREKYDCPVRMINPRGSAFGGNPPLSDTNAWQQLLRHAEWLGLNFIRVELSQRMYEPERLKFDWENEEMQALYRILDWCEKNSVDVFLQQMWANVEWNAFPGVHPLLSSPKSLDDFTHGIATLIKYLTETRKYTCIKYFCMINEPPGGPWGYWWNSGSHVGPSVTEGWEKLHETFIEQDIKIPISGPDWVSLPPVEKDKLQFEKYFGALDIHSYFGIYPDENKADIINDWVKFAKEKNKPFFLTELGNMSLGWGTDDPGPKSFKAALSNASDVALCMNLGVDGFNRWSFTNRGDLDGQWQLVYTFDRESKEYVKEVIPEPEAYYGFAFLTRFMSKYAKVLDLNFNDLPQGLIAAAFQNKDNSLGILVINNNEENVTGNINLANYSEKIFLHHYQIDEYQVNQKGFQLDPIITYKNREQLKDVKFPPKSIHMITSLKLKHDEAGHIQ
jgi:hypothetical protein